jgi:hypothetical protein
MFFCVLCGVYVYHKVPLVQFQPIYLDSRQQLQSSNERLTREQADKLVTVLHSNGEHYCRSSSNTVLITPALNTEKDLLWNYSSKAGL